MNKQEYAAFEKSFAAFMKREGITNLTAGHIRCPNCKVEFDETDCCPKCGEHRMAFDEPFFSKQSCDCCGTTLAGNRQHATGWNPEGQRAQEYDVCEDCIYYAEYGRLDDMTMLEVDADVPRTLSKPQERALLHKHLSGEFGPTRWPTIRSLIDAGMLKEEGRNLVVTDLGKAYCDQYHQDMKL